LKDNPIFAGVAEWATEQKTQNTSP
jgi:hypothetical protein